MPRLQVAAVPVFDFGAPAGGSGGEDTVLLFDVKQGGKIIATFEAMEDDLTVSLQARNDDISTWEDLTTADHQIVGAASGADIALTAKTQLTVAFNLRASDNGFRILAYSDSGARANVQIRGGEILSIDEI